MQSTSSIQPILLVDDHLTNLELLSVALVHAGYEVAVEMDGEGAIAQVLHNPPMLILMDVRMPGIDGFETCRRLKANPSSKCIPVIFMTALDDVSTKVKAFELGAVDYVTKPICTVEVLARVNTHVELYQLQQKLQRQNQQLEQEIGDRLRTEAELSRLTQDLELEVKQRSAALHASEERLRLVIEATQDAIWDWDACHKFMFRSQKIYDFFGLSSEPLDLEAPTQNSFYKRIHPDDRERFSQALQAHLAHDVPYKVELRIQRFNGEYGWFLDQGQAVRDAHGNVIRLVGAMSDITQQKESQLEIQRLNAELEDRVARRTAQLEALNQELESFSYSISHDLRAPLRHIHGFVTALRNKLQESSQPLDEKSSHYLSVIDDSSQKMGQLIDGLLLLSRVRRRSLRFQPINLNHIVRQAIAMVSPVDNVQENSIQWHIDTLPTVCGDPSLIQQVFINLIANAIKFSQNSTPPQIDIGITDTNTIFIRDNGVGFSMDYADKLFSPFERLHSQRDFNGTGIGLSIVQRIIHRHNGKIWAESELEKGATFFFILPLKNSKDY